jgi:predicted Zn-dependent protease
MTRLFLALLFAAPALAEAPLDPALDRQRYDGCVRALDSAPAKSLEFAQGWQARGGGLPARHCEALALLRLDRPADAARALEAGAEAARAAKAPQLADFEGQAGNAWFLAADLPRAEAAFTRAIAAAGEFAPQRAAGLHIDRARVRAEAANLSGARADLDQALLLHRDDPVAWMLSAALARRQGDLGRASIEIARASTLAPADPDIMFEQGNIAAANGDLAAAMRVWEMVTRAAPGSPAAELAKKALGAAPAS